MERVGRAQTLQCVITYADAGKSCTDGSQCQAGRCQGPMEAASRENVTGQCQPTNMAFGCYTTITNGRMGAAICVDCKRPDNRHVVAGFFQRARLLVDFYALQPIGRRRREQ